jgi:hypothetical protein
MQFITLISAVSAASVTIFKDRDYQGDSDTFEVDLNSGCRPIDRSSLQDEGSSVKWDLPPRSGICFFDNDDCRGKMKCWFSFESPPSNFKDAGINDRISAISGFTY